MTSVEEQGEEREGESGRGRGTERGRAGIAVGFAVYCCVLCSRASTQPALRCQVGTSHARHRRTHTCARYWRLRFFIF
jgi:hypothetical protein